jgi:hypothetical protein
MGNLTYPDDGLLLEWYVVVSYVTDGLGSAESIWRQNHHVRSAKLQFKPSRL